jgi:uncharacterized protein with GYD domain
MTQHYICLMNFTDQGARNIKDTAKRFKAAQSMAAEYGITFKSAHWTLGEYDVVCEIEAKDEAGFLAFGFATASMGNTRTKTLKAYTLAEVEAITAKLP